MEQIEGKMLIMIEKSVMVWSIMSSMFNNYDISSEACNWKL